MKWLGWMLLVATLFGCQRETTFSHLESVNRIVMIVPAPDQVSEPMIKEVDHKMAVEAVLRIFEEAKLGNRARDEELTLAPSYYFVFYDGEKEVKTLVFNGEYCQRVWQHWGWVEVSYQALNPGDFYSLYDQKAWVSQIE